MSKFHYVYRITNTIENKHYYGVRTSKVEPKLDLGFKYFSSSTDKEFIQEQKSHPEKFKYKIVQRVSTRVEALNLEIKLHHKFNVDINLKFYNKARQTSTGFSTQSIDFTIEKKAKWSEAATKREKTKTITQKEVIRINQILAYQNTSIEEKKRRVIKQLETCDYSKRDYTKQLNGTSNYYRVYNQHDLLVFEGKSKNYLQWIKDNNAPYASFMSSFRNGSEIVGHRKRVTEQYRSFIGYWVSSAF